MADPYHLSPNEWLWVSGLVLLIIWEFLRARFNREAIAMFRPTLVLAVVLAYYTLVGPLRGLAVGEWFDRGLNMRADMVIGWAGAFFFYGSVLIGFYLIPTPRFDRRASLAHTPERLYRLGTRLCQVGLGMFALVTGPRVVALINPFAARGLVDSFSEGVDAGGFDNYFLLALNCLIPGLVLLWASWLSSQRRLVPTLIWMLLTIGIFTTIGFRYRIVLAAVPLLLLWYLARQKRPNLVVVTLSAAGLLFMAGFIGLTRKYGSGLDLAAVDGLNNAEILQAGYHEAHVFLTTSGMMAITPKINPFVGAQPLISTAQFPIPSAFLPTKESNAYLLRSTETLFNSPTLGTGSAILCYGEWFLMAGWPSLIGMSVLLGWLLRCLWKWFLRRDHEPLAQCCYVIAVTYLYVVVSRGYMPQVVMLFFFTVFPAFWLYGRWSVPEIPHALPPGSPLPRG
jgi:hypothetical protein